MQNLGFLKNGNSMGIFGGWSQSQVLQSEINKFSIQIGLKKLHFRRECDILHSNLEGGSSALQYSNTLIRDKF